jgi:hypothetical protein
MKIFPQSIEECYFAGRSVLVPLTFHQLDADTIRAFYKRELELALARSESHAHSDYLSRDA